LALIITAVVAVLGLGAAWVGLGSLATRFVPLTLFEATVITALSTVAVAYTGWRFLGFILSPSPVAPVETDEEDWDDDEGEEDEDGDDDEWEEEVVTSRPAPARRSRRPQVPPVGRNDPCPCGSGKKYKHCHGKAAV